MTTETFEERPCFNRYGEQLECRKVDPRVASEDRKEWAAMDAEIARLRGEVEVLERALELVYEFLEGRVRGLGGPESDERFVLQSAKEEARKEVEPK